MIESASWPELAFTIPAIVGLLVCWWMFNAAVADLHYLYARGLNGAREIVAKASRRNELLRTAIQLIFLIIGIAAITDVPQPYLGLIVSGGIITAELLLVTKSILDRRDRGRVIEVLSRKDGES